MTSWECPRRPTKLSSRKVRTGHSVCRRAAGVMDKEPATNASFVMVAAAYRKLAMKWHPVSIPGAL